VDDDSSDIFPVAKQASSSSGRVYDDWIIH